MSLIFQSVIPLLTRVFYSLKNTLVPLFIGSMGLLIALVQLKVADDVIKYVILGLIGAASLAFGLSFGLGGARHAEEAIGHLKKRIGDQ